MKNQLTFLADYFINNELVKLPVELRIESSVESPNSKKRKFEQEDQSETESIDYDQESLESGEEFFQQELTKNNSDELEQEDSTFKRPSKIRKTTNDDPWFASSSFLKQDDKSGVDHIVNTISTTTTTTTPSDNDLFLDDDLYDGDLSDNDDLYDGDLSDNDDLSYNDDLYDGDLSDAYIQSPSNQKILSTWSNNNPQKVDLEKLDNIKKNLVGKIDNEETNVKITPNLGYYKNQIQDKPQIPKETIVSYTETISSVKISKKVSVDITGNGVNHLGRSKVEGSSTKQMRHVTPYTFAELMINDAVKNYEDKKSAASKLVDYLNILLSHYDGASVPEYLLGTEDYKSISNNIKKHSSKTLLQRDIKEFIISPDKVKNVFKTPIKKQKAIEEFHKKYPIFVKASMQKLLTAIGPKDGNTLVITAETVGKAILTAFNQRPGAAYPDEGNTLSYEIRYYKNKKDALNHNKKYEVISCYELKELIDAKGKEWIDGKIRLVNSEGPNVKKAKQALDLLYKIFNTNNNPDVFNDKMVFTKNSQLIHDVAEYNKKYNKTVYFMNRPPKDGEEILEDYNSELTDSPSLEEVLNHVTKQLITVFDYRALEDDVLIVAKKAPRNSIKLYKGAETESMCNAKIENGATYRDEVTANAKGYNKNVLFRNKEVFNLNNLAKKIVDHVSVWALPNSANAQNLGSTSLKKILNKFTKFICFDFNKISDSFELKDHTNKLFEKYLDIFSLEIDEEEINVEIKDKEFIPIIGDINNLDSY